MEVTTMDNANAVAREVIRRGPDRVMIQRNGRAVGSRIARVVHKIVPDVILIRNDGWTLAAPWWCADVAYDQWPDDWVAYLVRPEQEARPINVWPDGVIV